LPRDGAQPDSGALREHLRTRLPQYMVPQRFVTLDAFPLLPNGKIDRGALPAPESMEDEAKRPVLAPRTEAEKLIADVWSGLLRVERVSVQDNFFDLGGHSLLVAAAIAEIRKRTGVRLAINRFVFETLEQLAASLPGKPEAEGVDEQGKEKERGLLGRLFGRGRGA